MGVLILVNEENRKASAKDVLELPLLHQRHSQSRDVIMMQEQMGIVYASMPEIIIDPSCSNAACFFQFLSPGINLRNLCSQVRLEPLD